MKDLYSHMRSNGGWGSIVDGRQQARLVDEMLSTVEGREALLDAIPLLFEVNARTNHPYEMDVRVDRIAWSARHRAVDIKKYWGQDIEKPIHLNEVNVGGKPLYLVSDGNHRVERYVAEGRGWIPAIVTEWNLGRASISLPENGDCMLTTNSGTRLIMRNQALLLNKLGLASVSPEIACPRQRQRPDRGQDLER